MLRCFADVRKYPTTEPRLESNLSGDIHNWMKTSVAISSLSGPTLRIILAAAVTEWMWR